MGGSGKKTQVDPETTTMGRYGGRVAVCERAVCPHTGQCVHTCLQCEAFDYTVRMPGPLAQATAVGNIQG